MHLKNLTRILKYTLKETSPGNIVDTLYEKTKYIIEKHITQRDVENFVDYLKFLVDSTYGQKPVKIEDKVVIDFVDRTYSECDQKTKYLRSENLNIFFENKLGTNVVLNNKELEVLYQKLRSERKTSMEKVMMRVCVALVLKWLQASVHSMLSERLNNYVAYLASIYGLYGTNRLFNVDWQPFEITQHDSVMIGSEYGFFEKTISDAIRCLNSASFKIRSSSTYKDQFKVVLTSIDELIMMSESGKLDSAEAFKNKIIIAATLVYLQDDYVEKDHDLERLIKLFLSFYYQFRDKRYIPVFSDSSSVTRFC